MEDFVIEKKQSPLKMCPPRRNLPFVKAPFSELRVNSPCANSRLILLQSAEYQFQPPRLSARVSLSFDVSSSQAIIRSRFHCFWRVQKELPGRFTMHRFNFRDDDSGEEEENLLLVYTFQVLIIPVIPSTKALNPILIT